MLQMSVIGEREGGTWWPGFSGERRGDFGTGFKEAISISVTKVERREGTPDGVHLFVYMFRLLLCQKTPDLVSSSLLVLVVLCHVVLLAPGTVSWRTHLAGSNGVEMVLRETGITLQFRTLSLSLDHTGNITGGQWAFFTVGKTGVAHNTLSARWI